MRITYPRSKRRIHLMPDAGVVYVILGRGEHEKWWLQNFWGRKVAFKTYAEACKEAKRIGKSMKHYEWKDPKPIVAKIDLGR